ncbi:MAG: hypothetical protein QOE14_176, partial [Humisphaera sp.]|nr:hypothetical protein [Humisphaera sp.]
MMVIAVIAIAAVLGYVMLSTASLQNRAGSNQSKLVSADYLAESGLNIAMYYLQHPEQAPATNADGYWAGMNTNYTLPNGSPSTLIVSVTQALDTSTAPSTSVPWTYEVVSSASVGSSDDPSRRVTRTTGARIFVRREYGMRPGAVLANNNITFVGPITANGDVYGSKNMALKNGPSGTPVVNGAGYSMTQTTGAGYLFPRDLYHGIVNSSAGTPIAPRNADVNLYKTYTVDDKPYSADILDALTSLLNGLLGLLTRQPSANNPGGVMFKEGTFTLSDNVTINGTLVVDG